MTPTLIIHGGAGRTIRSPERIDAVRTSLHNVVRQVYGELLAGMSAMDAVELGCCLLEDDPHFNSGTGSALQADGQVRMTASIMDGIRQRLSGVINVERVRNPILLARRLQEEPDRILAAPGVESLAREMKLPIHNPIIARRVDEWMAHTRRNHALSMADVVAEESDERGMGTIGVVARDTQGQLSAGTSTGGRGFERSGRVSDSVMPSGNYATQTAAVSCTGIGEHINDEALAARIVVRTEDGFSLRAAVEKSCREALVRERVLGAIALSASGDIAWGKTSAILLAAYHTGTEIQDTLDLDIDPCTGGFDPKNLARHISPLFADTEIS